MRVENRRGKKGQNLIQMWIQLDSNQHLTIFYSDIEFFSMSEAVKC
jgi:hypothetical protein